jgi:hypothetical protein
MATKSGTTKKHSSGAPGTAHTAAERSAVNKLVARDAASSLVRLKLVKDGGVLRLDVDYPDDVVGTALLMDALATGDVEFMNGVISQLGKAATKDGEVSERDLNFMFSIIKGIQPRDQLEAMLAAQMAALHVATMTFGRRLANVENIPQQDSAERAFNKLSRTFTTQMEALKRYRTGGEQKVTVQHVSVAEGGQAIVGNVTQSPGQKSMPNETTTSPLALTDANASPMPIIDRSKQAVPVPTRRPRPKLDQK